MKQQAAAVFCCILIVKTEDKAEMIWLESCGCIKRSNKAIQTGEVGDNAVNVETSLHNNAGPSLVVMIILIDGKSIRDNVCNNEIMEWIEWMKVFKFVADETRNSAINYNKNRVTHN